MVATCDAAGQPYITPLNYVFHRGNIYFHSAPKGHKLDNIAVNSRVCFEVSQTDKPVFAEKACACSTRYTSVVVFGRARVVTDDGEKVDALNALTEKIAAGRQFVPATAADARLRIGDEGELTIRRERVAAEARLRAVSRRGKLAYWFDEYGEPD